MPEQSNAKEPDSPARLQDAPTLHALEGHDPSAQVPPVSAQLPAPMSPDGYVEAITHLGARGWAWSPSSPDTAVEVEAVLDSRVIGRATADRMRPDLKERNYGSGHHGFEMAFDAPITGTRAPIMRIVGRGAGGLKRLAGDYEVKSSELRPRMQSVSAAAPEALAALPVSVKGYVEKITQRGAQGWAWSPSSPDTVVAVEAILDGRIIGRGTADRMRRDLKERNIGTGDHGFEMSFDEQLTGGNIPMLRVISADGPIRLPGDYELRTLDLPAAPEGYVECITPLGANGWAWSPSFPETFVQVEAVIHGRVIGRAMAERMRPDLKERNYGSGQHGFELVFDERVSGEVTPKIHVVGPEGVTPLPGVYELQPIRHQSLTNGHAPATEPLDLSPSTAPAAPEGYVESITRRGARGWAWSPSSPGIAVQVEATLEGRVIGRATADRMRPDLLSRSLGTGLYGFAMSFDEQLTGDQVPEFRVLVPAIRCLQGVKTLPGLTPQDAVRHERGTIATWYKEHAEFTTRGPRYEDFDETIISEIPTASDTPRPLLLAFYLPQYHPIPENDEFWGKGFTEWRQIARGTSRFPGHYQPRIPRDLGFYDLNNLNTLRAQAALAKGAGIHAFSYYYYWFNGKRVLEKPLNMLLASDVDMPFMILWANENWTRTWDGSESEVLLRQDYRREDEDALLKDLARHFLDDRYVRIAGRPLFCIYNPGSIPEPMVTIARWRNILALRYALEPLIYMAQTFGARDPRDYGCDGAIEFPPHKTAEKLVGRLTPDAYSPGYTSQILTYDDFVDASLKEEAPEYPLIKTAVPSWDNESRRPNRSLTLERLSPDKYQAWLHTLIRRAIDRPILGTPVVAINAWNEWAEAAYLEPDVYYGASYLNATARAYVSAVSEPSSVTASNTG